MKQGPTLRHLMEWVSGGVHIVYHEPSTDPIHVLPTHGSSSACSLASIRYHLRTGAPRVCPGTGHPTLSHDGLGGLLVQRGSLPASAPPFLSTWTVAYIPWSTFHCVQITHQDSLRSPIEGKHCPLLLCYNQSILVCSVHFCSRRVKAEHWKGLSFEYEYVVNQICWYRGQPPRFTPSLPRYALRCLATRSLGRLKLGKWLEDTRMATCFLSTGECYVH